MPPEELGLRKKALLAHSVFLTIGYALALWDLLYQQKRRTKAISTYATLTTLQPGYRLREGNQPKEICMLKIISWNIHRRDDAWRVLAESDADIALLQEATPPPSDVAGCFEIDRVDWRTTGGKRPWRAVVVRRQASQVQLKWLVPRPIGDVKIGEYQVSRPGTLAVATVSGPSIPRDLIVASMYGLWEPPHPSLGDKPIFADASVHRVISDLSAFYQVP